MGTGRDIAHGCGWGFVWGAMWGAVSSVMGPLLGPILGTAATGAVVGGTFGGINGVRRDRHQRKALRHAERAAIAGQSDYAPHGHRQPVARDAYGPY
jgi:hypothetical protein